MGSLGEVLTGNTPPTSDKSDWVDGTAGRVWITPSDISSLKTNNSLRHLSNQGWEKARILPANSVLITSIASIGKNTINEVPAAFNQQINAIIPKHNDSYFILSSMLKNTAKFKALAGQTATAIINKSAFEKFCIDVPSVEEQERIALIIKNIDDTITLHQ
ncbi:restriction endonuclease subunit S [Fructobacillus sp. M1-13]|uniref:Type I restriction modification DNA specificity domain-containing protein n=1 Tax=Fructobacillus papyriferae TaxID=2713171 RepID=A0ABS5QQV3_9LACO|nr:hypothetical protein [Fructobacillus papyriferae]MCD2159332.1 restriction endonuclease subunit S [Fructobacillus papyriferae]